MSGRRAEIEAKRAKLAELRRAREEREERARKLKAGPGDPHAHASAVSAASIDELVASLLGSAHDASKPSNPSQHAAPPATAASPSKDVAKADTVVTPSSSAQPASTSTTITDPSTSQGSTHAVPSDAPSVRPLTPPSTQPGSDSQSSHHEEPHDEPSTSSKHSTMIPTAQAPQRILYTKQVQTDPIETDDVAPIHAEKDAAKDAGIVHQSALASPTSPSAPAPQPPSHSPHERVPCQGAADGSVDLVEPSISLSPLERDTHQLPDADFTDFVHAKATVMERMLDERYNVLTDYTHVPTEDAQESKQTSMHLVRTFMDHALLETRSVTDVDWSAKHPELVVASYNRKRVLVHEDDHDGIVAVWNMHMRERPEFVFTAPTDVVSVLASPFHPNLFIGGTFGGQVLLWDTRQRGLPVQRTPWAFSASATGLTHSAPVYTVRLVGSAQAHQLISASSDGVVCTWSLDMLARPQESISLTNPMHPRSAKVGVTSLDVAPHDTSHFFVATDEGNLFDAQRFDRAGIKAGLSMSHAYVGHTAHVTRLECHPTHMFEERLPLSISELFLTSSMDWTTALWRPSNSTTSPAGTATDVASAAASASVSSIVSPAKNFSVSSASPVPSPLRVSSSSHTSLPSSMYYYPHANPRIATSQRTNPLAFRTAASDTPPWSAVAPLARFDQQQDYVMDVRWHPQHPGIFAQVDASGHVDMYNLCQSVDRPVLSASTPQGRGLNRVAWERRGTLPEHGTQGATRLAAGGMDGRLHVFQVPDAFITVRGEADVTEMERVLAAMG